MEVQYSRQALRSLARIHRQDAKRVRDAINAYAADPASKANNIKQLRNSPFTRLRVGNYRVIMNADGVILEIVDVGHRKDVYR